MSVRPAHFRLVISHELLNADTIMLLMRRALASGRYPGFSVAALPIATVFVPVHEGRYGGAGPSLSMSLPLPSPSPSFMRVLEIPSGRETATHTLAHATEHSRACKNIFAKRLD